MRVSPAHAYIDLLVDNLGSCCATSTQAGATRRSAMRHGAGI